jgi:hypothetical protein
MAAMFFGGSARSVGNDVRRRRTADAVLKRSWLRMEWSG